MLSGEDNAGERWKTTVGIISKNISFARTAHFFVHSLPLFCTTTTWSFQKLLSYTFYGGNIGRFLVHFVFIAAHFHLALATASISHLVTAVKKFSCCSSNKRNLSFLSLALDFCRPFSRWTSLACRLLSLFPWVALALYSKFGDMTINLSLIL